MAILAHVGGLDVRGILAGRIGAVVTADAIAADVGVIEVCGDPAGRKVAIRAVITARQVGRCLAGCNRAIVTGLATADYLQVIYGKRRRKGTRRVTIFANIRGRGV